MTHIEAETWGELEVRDRAFEGWAASAAAAYREALSRAADPGRREDLAVFFGRATTYANLLFHGHMGADQNARAGEMPAHWARAMGEDPETAGTAEEGLVRGAIEDLLEAQPHRRDHNRKLMSAYDALRELPPRKP